MFALSLFLKLLRFVFLFIWPKSTNSKCQQTQHWKIFEKVWPDDLYIFTDLKIRFEIWHGIKVINYSITLRLITREIFPSINTLFSDCIVKIKYIRNTVRCFNNIYFASLSKHELRTNEYLDQSWRLLKEYMNTNNKCI